MAMSSEAPHHPRHPPIDEPRSYRHHPSLPPPQSHHSYAPNHHSLPAPHPYQHLPPPQPSHIPKEEPDVHSRLRLGSGQFPSLISGEAALLRVKLQALEQFVQHNGIKLLGDEENEAEEARALQYRCETLQVAIAYHGIDITEPRFTETLKTYPSSPPPSFGSWLAENLSLNDPIARSVRDREPCALRSVSFKCHIETCLHYVYGFASRETRDTHIREHQMDMGKRDSALALTPTGFEAQKEEDKGDIREATRGDIGPCLRCKMTNKTCDLGSICAACTNPNPNPEEDRWNAIGCLRVNESLGRLVTRMLPGCLFPGRSASSCTTSLATQRLTVDNFLESTYRTPESVIMGVQHGLDYHDNFWHTDSLTPLGGRPTRPPLILSILLNSRNTTAGKYNFMDVLHCSQKLARSRQDEQMTLPVLYAAKVLLKQALFVDLLQGNPVVISNDQPIYPGTPSGLEGVDRDRYCRQVYDALVTFLESFQDMTMHRGPLTSRSWFAGFFAVCLFSIVKHLITERLIQMNLGSTSRSRPQDDLRVVDDIYKVIVTIFIQASPIIHEDGRVSMNEHDKMIMNNIDSIMVRSNWVQSRTQSISDFLFKLGDRNAEPYSFVCSVSQSARFPLLPMAKEAPKDVHRPWSTNSPVVDAGDFQSRYADSPKAFESPRPARMRSESMYSKAPESPIRPMYGRPPYSRKFPCDRCPEDFRSDNDLRRHSQAKHGVTKKGFMCIEPASLSPDLPRPSVPLAGCRTCKVKRFKSYQSAVTHLQRHHFINSSYSHRPGSASELMPEHLLRDWIFETRYIPDPLETSDDETESATPTEYNRSHGPAPSTTSLPSPASALSNSSSFGHSGIPPLHEKPTPRSIGSYALPPPSSGDSMPYTAPRYGSPAPAVLPPPRATPAGPGPQPSLREGSGIQLPPINSSLAPPGPPPALSHSSSYHSDSAYSSQGASGPLPPSGSPGMGYHSHRGPPPPGPGPGPGPSPAPGSGYRQPPPPLQTSFASTSTSAPYQPQPMRPAGTNLLQPPPGIYPPDELPYSPSKTPENRTRCPHPDCGRVFKDLQSHMLTHQEQRPEKCPIDTCEYHTKGFARKYDKNRHALTHYKGTMICPFCPGVGTGYEKAFNRADVFKRHLTSIHHVEQAPPNSRRPVGGSSRNSGAGGGSTVNLEAICSICRGGFTTAQEFYEHLDECVLNEIIPVASGSTAATRAGSSSGAAATNGGSITGERGREWDETQSVVSVGSNRSKGKSKDKKI